MLPTPIVKDIDIDNVYEPAEDSFLLLDCLEEQYQFITERFRSRIPLVTEIGTGSGIVTTFIQQNILPQSMFITTDINPHACKTVLQTDKDNNIDSKRTKEPYVLDSCQMNLTAGIRHGTIDMLVFNPPYVPAFELPNIPTTEEDKTWLDLALLGGEDGMVVTWRLLNELDAILTPEIGVAYILFCARNKPKEVAKTMQEKGWDVKTIIFRKAGWEELSVLRFIRP
ncbi:unnamed protein product [Debaryomyces tyrocola]|nr:unnamed protein product [Debaryomyces tyrocola]